MLNHNTIQLLIYLLPMLCIWFSYRYLQNVRHARALATFNESRRSGLTDPPSLHPEINPSRCMGCGACVHACPEGNILGLIKGKAQLLEPANCIGHGACHRACPFDAITLVFGTATRGIDIPLLSSSFETSVKGIYIAGELGGMGLINNAISQGKQAVQAISRSCKSQSSPDNNTLDLIIVGAGPAGIAASLQAKSDGLKCVAIEQNQLGGTVSHYPRNKIVMTRPVNLPLAGKIVMRETSKESLLELWQSVIDEHKPSIQFGERLISMSGSQGAFTVSTSAGTYQASHVLLCLGRRGTPRSLDVPGEDLPKVVYQLMDPSQYENHKVLVVGGGDSALEAAIAVAEAQGTEVTLCYRGQAFSRAKAKNRQKVESLAAADKLTVLLQSEPILITPEAVHVNCSGQIRTLDNDAVIICAGGILPTPFLKSLGIQIETKYGTA
jgi:thioredoxin reductase (NADPH)